MVEGLLRLKANPRVVLALVFSSTCDGDRTFQLRMSVFSRNSLGAFKSFLASNSRNH